jgi:outer membrane protein assembly factor BamD
MKRLGPLLLLCACKGFGTFLGGDVSEPSYADEAEVNLKRGDDALDSKNYIEAQKYFDYVKSKYPYLEAATTAELRLADVDFEREKFLEARDRYINFIKLHPTHPKIDYAAFRAALTHYKDMPSDFFLLPPGSEKDQAEVRAASVALADFIRSYPSSEYVKDAQKSLDDVRKKLAKHELYVAGFYERRKKWPAVVGRLNVLAKDFGGLGYEEKVYFGLYDAYRKIQADAKQKVELSKLELTKAQAEVEKAAGKVTDDQLQRVVTAQTKVKDAETSVTEAEGKPEESLKELVAKYPDTEAAKRAQKILEKSGGT